MVEASYIEFLEQKIVLAESFGFEYPEENLYKKLLPHQKEISLWCLEGGRRACFAGFGLGKTVMQLQVASAVIEHIGKPFLICMPLGVVGEFKRDNELISSRFEIQYISDSDSLELQKIENAIINSGNTIPELEERYISTLKEQDDINFNFKPKIYLTNYERVRKGDIDASKFGGVSFDEASAIRNLKTKTTDYILHHFRNVPFRFVFTATPTPNDYIEILNYADFLGVIDRGQALTRFFKRDSTKAGNLKLYENKKDEFWKWVASWAVFINRPSDLGYDDTGYVLPKLNVHEIEVSNTSDYPILNKKGEQVLFKDITKSLIETSKEKRESIDVRVTKAYEIVQEKGKYSNWILWHHLEDERRAIEKAFSQDDYIDLRSVYGGQTNAEKEKLLIDFSESYYQILATKPTIAGSGYNFQHACSKAIFVGIDYKFNEFIQAIHRIYRFRQTEEVGIYIIFTQNEYHVLQTLKEKWKRHIELQSQMINLVREYGLNQDKIKSDMKRQIFNKERYAKIGGAEVWNQDCVVGMDKIEDDSIDLIITSIPFGDHYEYSDNYNDFGHNDSNTEFFEQMDFLTPKLLRSLKPGRVAAIHVKDRIRYSHQNGTCFTTIDDFSGETVAHFKKHGFYLMGKITITTDVVRENNQTYRLTWGEQAKDATKMGVGLPEYVLLFRKAPTDNSNAYADEPVTKSKEDYNLARWQLDAHAYWKSSGDRFLTEKDLRNGNMKQIFHAWKNHDKSTIYDFQQHLLTCEDLDEYGLLSKLFMTLPPTSNNDYVWDDVNRMKTLNTNQVNRKKEKHICPLQFDVIDRLMFRFSNEGETILDPFGGLFSTAYRALKFKRNCKSFELNPSYFDDGLFYLKSIEYQINIPTLFDFVEPKKEVV